MAAIIFHLLPIYICNKHDNNWSKTSLDDRIIIIRLVEWAEYDHWSVFCTLDDFLPIFEFEFFSVDLQTKVSLPNVVQQWNLKKI